jgi:hypothetical protein
MHQQDLFVHTVTWYAAAAPAPAVVLWLQPHMAIVGANAFSHESGMQ